MAINAGTVATKEIIGLLHKVELGGGTYSYSNFDSGRLADLKEDYAYEERLDDHYYSELEVIKYNKITYCLYKFKNINYPSFDFMRTQICISMMKNISKINSSKLWSYFRDTDVLMEDKILQMTLELASKMTYTLEDFDMIVYLYREAFVTQPIFIDDVLLIIQLYNDLFLNRIDRTDERA